ncbi:MAG: aldose 1-epimerase [Planctomycetes bacterium]|nr:aldose 1-epimerase [Planctomycetota bacterium]
MRLTITLAAVFAVSPAPAADYPHVVLKNDGLKFALYETDAAKGFYRGTRFDHAGVFGHVEFAGHTIFGPWKDKHDPTNHDDIVGPCEEFGITAPLGYDAAKAGETFLKIGVGELEKPKEEKYSFAKKYKVVKPLEWKQRRREIESGGEAYKGTQVLIWETQQKANGYGYSYWKAVSLNGKKSSIQISHVLTNTGEKRIVTDFYNHNFFNVDGDAIGPNYSFVFPCAVKAQDPKGKFGDLVELKDKEFRFKDKLPVGDFVMAGLTGFDAKDEKHRAFEMRHAPSGVVVKVEHSYPFAKFNVWGIRTTICPEPYMAIDLKPGEEMKWSIVYTFTHAPPKK